MTSIRVARRDEEGRRDRREGDEEDALEGEIDSVGNRLGVLYRNRDRLSREDRRRLASELTGELVKLRVKLGEYNAARREFDKAGENFEKAAGYLTEMAEEVDEGDHLTRARYAESALNAYQYAITYAHKSGDFEREGEIRERMDEQVSELERIAGHIERTRKRLAAVALFGVLSLMLSVMRITGFAVGNETNASLGFGILGVLCFIIAVVLMILVVKESKH